MVEKYATINTIGNGTIGIQPVLNSIVLAVPLFFPILLFLLLIGGTFSIYFSIFKTTGRKRFWESLTAMSFVCFLLSVIIVVMNNPVATYLSGYWILFYIVLTIFGWLIMDNYI
jgi:hypothetical protein